MEFQLWWLLALPLFFMLGWGAARVDIHHALWEARALPRSYFRGLNFLLSEQPDKAIEAFLEAAEVDPETAELHFALGNLFRRRGEMDRAIRVHKYLVNRDGLSEDQRLTALCELGHDYLRAGLLDRAEKMFQRLLSTPRQEEAQYHLIDVYQQEREWGKAIEIANALPDSADHKWSCILAQFHCELASEHLLYKRYGAAQRQRDTALSINRRCIRAFILQSDLALAQGRTQEAFASWQRIAQQKLPFLALVAEKMLATYEAEGRSEQGRELLLGYIEQEPSIDLLRIAYSAQLKAKGAEAAYQVVRDTLRKSPTLLGLDKLLEAQLQVTPVEKRADFEIMKNLIHQHSSRVALYPCSQCGFKARQYYWRCPACGGWETYPPRRAEEIDLRP